MRREPIFVVVMGCGCCCCWCCCLEPVATVADVPPTGPVATDNGIRTTVCCVSIAVATLDSILLVLNALKSTDIFMGSQLKNAAIKCLLLLLFYCTWYCMILFLFFLSLLCCRIASRLQCSPFTRTQLLHCCRVFHNSTVDLIKDADSWQITFATNLSLVLQKPTDKSRRIVYHASAAERAYSKNHLTASVCVPCLVDLCFSIRRPTKKESKRTRIDESLKIVGKLEN